MAVVWQASGTLLGSTGADITPVIPTHTTNDILILHAWARSSSVTLTTPSGWTPIEGPIDQGSTMRNYWYWKRATNGSTTNPLCDWSATTGDKYGVVHVFRGVRTSGNPWDAEQSSVGTADPGTAAGVTASHLNTLIVSVGMSADNAASTVTVTATSPASLTTRSYTTVNTGGDAGQWAASGAKATAGASGNIGLDFDAAPLQWANLSLALVPPPTTHSGTATLAGTAAIAAAATSMAKFKKDLVAYYRLEADGTDSTGRGNTLTDNNTVTFQAEKVGSGAKFTRANNESLSRAHGGDLTFNGTDFTIQVWVKITSGIGTNWQQFVSKRADPNNRAFSLWMTPDAGGVIQFLLSSDGTNNDTLLNEYPNNQPPTSGTWYHILAWVTGGNAYIQVNGGSVYSQACAGVYNSTATFYLGDDGPGGAEFDGEMDEVAIWKRALNADERAWLYNSGTGRTYSEVAPSTTHSGTATLAGAATIAARGGRTRPGTIGVTGTATIAARGTRKQPGSAALAGAATIAAAGTFRRLATSTLAGAATIAASAVRTAGGRSAVVGAAAVAAIASRTASARASTTGTATIAARGGRIVSGTAFFDATGSVFTAGLRTRYGRSELMASAALAASAVRTANAAASFASAATVAASAVRTAYASAAFVSIATTTATGQRTAGGRAAFVSIATTTATGLRAAFGSSSIAASAALAASGVRVAVGSASIAASAAIAAAGDVATIVHDKFGAALLAVVATLSAVGRRLAARHGVVESTARARGCEIVATSRACMIDAASRTVTLVVTVVE